MPDFSKYQLSEKYFKGELSLSEVVAAPVWNRLEVNPRNADSCASFKAEIHDPLWMLTRQWQLGEFVGDDAGSMIFTNLSAHSSALNVPAGLPLEAMVERQSLFENNEPRAMNLTVRLQIASYWLKLLKTGGLQAKANDFVNYNDYLLTIPADPAAEAQVFQLEEFVKGRSFDGWIFYNDAARFDRFNGNDQQKFKDIFRKLQNWFGRYIEQPGSNAGQWQPENLEYQFNTKMQVKNITSNNFTEYNLGTNEYYQGSLDWYHFEIQGAVPVAANIVSTQPVPINYPDNTGRNLIPGPVSFDGMPEKRYWAIEDAKTNFAAVRADKLDLGKMALIEFGLIYGNDWNLIPVKIPAGSFLQVDKLEVVDSFGKITLVPANGTAAQSTWNDWKFFALNSTVADKPQGLLMPPVARPVQMGKPFEEVNFIRDEVANMIWGIETIVPNVEGKGISGRELTTAEQPVSKGSQLTYQAQTAVPANWIPFLPVQHPTISEKIIMRRGSMLDDQNKRIRPNTSLLRKGLQADGKQTVTYDIDENEIGREGVLVRKAFNRTRWINGEVCQWIGIDKKAGYGEGSSMLEFDKLLNK